MSWNDYMKPLEKYDSALIYVKNKSVIASTGQLEATTNEINNYLDFKRFFNCNKSNNNSFGDIAYKNEVYEIIKIIDGAVIAINGSKQFVIQFFNDFVICACGDYPNVACKVYTVSNQINYALRISSW